MIVSIPRGKKPTKRMNVLAVTAVWRGARRPARPSGMRTRKPGMISFPAVTREDPGKISRITIARPIAHTTISIRPPAELVPVALVVVLGITQVMRVVVLEPEAVALVVVLEPEAVALVAALREPEAVALVAALREAEVVALAVAVDHERSQEGQGRQVQGRHTLSRIQDTRRAM
jgi:hypothetical protein